MPERKNPDPTKPGPRRSPTDEPSPPKKQNQNPTKEGLRAPPPGKGR